ncbi:hypothetical protein K523DRAFT_344026 [Schizophyllum commune Tattone D]|nr:hypothetical protein K523DRAFT_344026 [Schizophyllum commune Tattone D]
MRQAQRRRRAFGRVSSSSIGYTTRVAAGSPAGSRITYLDMASRSSIDTCGSQAPSRSGSAVGAASKVEVVLVAEGAEGEDEDDELLAAVDACHRTRKAPFPVLGQ